MKTMPDGQVVETDTYGRETYEVRIYCARHKGTFGFGISPEAAELAFKAAGGSIKSLREAASYTNDLRVMVAFPRGATHFGIDGMGSIWQRGATVEGDDDGFTRMAYRGRKWELA